MAHKILIDTCVWIDLVDDPDDEILGKIERLVRSGDLQLLKPEVLVIEFDRNKQNRAQRLRQKIQASMKNLLSHLREFGTEAQLNSVSEKLDEFSRRVPGIEAAIQNRIARIDALLRGADAITASQGVKDRTGERAIHKKAPFQNGNGYADTIIIETFAEKAANDLGTTFTFISTNRNDFSDPADAKRPHPDLSALFGPNCTYSLNIAETLNVVRASLPPERAAAEPALAAEVVNRVAQEVEHKWKCPQCHEGHMNPNGWHDTHHGMTWHYICDRCGYQMQRTEFYDD